ncbi:hypothetical protein L2E82_36463 [Cichorium intybus]|uniref:Uncharacterized protein n=1 Tax=Cichorium intybus TaxID=13427 RepID=A0ACB9BRL0_CICIN|nr:hypothetical protein L2E82_36463 [Cichorium intybus]
MKGHLSAPLSTLLGICTLSFGTGRNKKLLVVLDTTTSYLSTVSLSVLGATWCGNIIHPQMIMMVSNLYIISLAQLVCHRQSPLNALVQFSHWMPVPI